MAKSRNEIRNYRNGPVMNKTNTLTFKLAKLMIAVSWADGTLENSEINAIKDMLFSLPDLDEREWAQLDVFMDSPVDESEREMLLDDVLASIRTTQEKNTVVQTLEKLVAVDGVISGEEQTILNELKSTLESRKTGFLGLFLQLTGGTLLKQKEKLKKQLRREQQIEDFIRNKVLYDLKRNHPEFNHISDDQLNKLCSAAALLGRVAFVDDDFPQNEFEAIVSVLMSDWNLSETDAILLAEIVRRRVMEDIDYHYITQSFFEQTSPGERKRFIRCLFQIANASEKTSYQEIEEIRTIANSLKISHDDFIEAKLSISDKERKGL